MFAFQHGCFSLHRAFTLYPFLSLQPSPLPQCKRRGSGNPADTVTRVRDSYRGACWSFRNCILPRTSPSPLLSHARQRLLEFQLLISLHRVHSSLLPQTRRSLSRHPIVAREAHRQGTDRAAAYSLSTTVVGASTPQVSPPRIYLSSRACRDLCRLHSLVFFRSSGIVQHNASKSRLTHPAVPSLPLLPCKRRATSKTVVENSHACLPDNMPVVGA
jgi:hypothetical protein